MAFSPSSSLTSVPTSTLKKANNVGPLFSQNKYHDESSINSIDQFDFPQNESSSSENLFKLLGPLTVATLASTPLPAEAAQNDQIASAVAAYGHYLSLFVMVGALTFERFTVAPGMSQDDEKGLGIADALLGVSGVALLVSGYYRATLYGKVSSVFGDMLHQIPPYLVKIPCCLCFVCLHQSDTIHSTTIPFYRSFSNRI